jgi:succinoglycan biosynthesis protein ExoO
MTNLKTYEIDVSVVIPAYRAVDFINRAIDSALAQSGVRLEIIVVDDACPMSTGDAVRRQYHDNSSVKVAVLPENGGPSAARNVGFSLANGEWIAILDADDAFDAGRLKRLIDAGRLIEADVIADNVRLYDAIRHSLSEPKIKSIKKPTVIDIYSLVAGSRPETGDLDFGLLKPAFRRAFIETANIKYPLNIRHGEDFHFYFDIIMAGGKFIVIPEAGYHWTLRNSGNSQTNIDYLQQVNDTRSLKTLESVEGDERLTGLIEQRCAALIRLHDRRAYISALKKRNYISVAMQILRRPHLARDLAYSIRRRLGVA